MRTFHGNKVTAKANVNRTGTSVTEEKFSASEELRRLRGQFGEDVSAETAASEVAPVKVYKHAYISPTFTQKMIAADETIQERYDELKNYAIRFRKLKSRISRKYDSINLGRLHFVKFMVAGKTLKLYLNVDPSLVDPKFHCVDVSKKVSYKTVPVMLRIKSARGVKYAKILIDRCAEQHGFLPRRKKKEVDSMTLVREHQKMKDEKFKKLHPELFPEG